MKSFGALASWLTLPLEIDPQCDREEMFIEAQSLAIKLNVNVRFEVDGMTCTLGPQTHYNEAYQQYLRIHRKALANPNGQ